MAAAVCPGAPFLIADPSTNPARLGARVPGLAAACPRRGRPRARGAAARRRGTAGPEPRRPSTGRLLRPGHRWSGRDSGAATSGWWRRSPPDPAGPTPPVLALPGTVVGLDLLAAAGLGAPTWAWEVGPGRPPIDLDPARDAHRWGLLVSADGAARHGDDAPGRRDARSAAFDTAVAAALGAAIRGHSPSRLDDPALPADDLLAGCAALRPARGLDRRQPAGPGGDALRGRAFRRRLPGRLVVLGHGGPAEGARGSSW